MAPWAGFVVAGAAIGLCMGLFGVGGSSVATPVLALLGVPGLAAVASPLPATIPAAAVDAVPYVRFGEVRPHAAAWSVFGTHRSRAVLVLVLVLVLQYPRKPPYLLARL